MADYTSRQVARMLGISAPTLSNYIKVRKIPSPKSVTVGGITVHIWTEADIEHLRKLLPKIANGRKTRYQKQKSEVRSQKSVEAKSKPKKPQPRAAVQHKKKKK